ncbi:IstB ATP binding domain-containing protein, partial [Pseudomonas syringae pv. actinidiae ICMP 19098]
DDWGLAPFTAAQRRDMLELLDDRYGNRSTLVTSQMPVDKWHARSSTGWCITLIGSN